MGADCNSRVLAAAAACAVLAASSPGGLIMAAVECPEACSCKWKGGKETVECVNASLTAIPDMAADTQVLDLGSNRLADALRYKCEERKAHMHFVLCCVSHPLIKSENGRFSRTSECQSLSLH